MQSADHARDFVSARKIDSFESLAKFTTDTEQRYRQLEEVHLSRLAKARYDKEHKESLAKYHEMWEKLQKLLEQGEKITLKQWKAEIQSLQIEYDRISREQAVTATELAYAEVISYNKKNLDRELQNESRQQKRGRSTRVNLEND